MSHDLTLAFACVLLSMGTAGVVVARQLRRIYRRLDRVEQNLDSLIALMEKLARPKVIR